MSCLVCFRDKCTCTPRAANEAAAKPKFKTNKKKKVLCYLCDKPIHVDKFAGINKHGLFHNMCILMDAFDNSMNESTN